MHPFVMFRSLCLFILIIFSKSLLGQEAFRVPAAFQSVGDASVSIQSPLSIYSNPAGFADERQPSVGVQYENRFLLKELRTASGFFILPVHRSTFGFSISQFGQGSWRESQLSLGLAKKLSGRLATGMVVHYYGLYLAENRNHIGILLADLGIQYQFKNGFRAGMQLFNPYSYKANELNLKFEYPTVFRAGLQKVIDNSLLLAFECRKQLDSPVEFRGGMEFKIREQVQLRMGIDARASVFAMGVGYSLKGFQTDLSFSYHQYLGYSPAFSIYYQLP